MQTTKVLVKVARPDPGTTHPGQEPIYHPVYVPGDHPAPPAPRAPQYKPSLEELAANDMNWLATLVAIIMLGPVENLQRGERVGRFEIVNYRRVLAGDPDVMVAFVPGAIEFHQTIGAIQQSREAGYTPEAFYQEMHRHLRRLRNVLQSLQPSIEETIFVIGWAAGIQAGAKQIRRWRPEPIEDPVFLPRSSAATGFNARLQREERERTMGGQ